MTFKVNALQIFPCFPGFRNALKYIQTYGRITSESRGTVGVEVIVASLRLYPTIWLQKLNPCYKHETQILHLLPRLEVEVTSSHDCIDIKRTFLPYGKNLWGYENRVRKKILPERRYRVWRKTHNRALVICA
jgi:hypothetical protein